MYRLGLLPSISTYLTYLFTGYEWSRSSPLRSSPDTSSSMYPDRPIRPLPRRSLRARLSPEQAETIEFPNNPPSAGPLFSYPYSANEHTSRALRTGESDHHACHCGHTHSEVESEEEEDERGAPIPSSPSYQYSRHLAGKPVTGVVVGYPKPGSVASSADGYDSFENTNNKKKRKIPNMGSNGSHHASLSADLTTATDPGATTALHLLPHNTAPRTRGQAFQAQAEDALDDLGQDGQSGACWATRRVSVTPKQAANVRSHLGNTPISTPLKSVR
jgi:hypothetical protein